MTTASYEACCGEHPPGVAGEPLVVACQLCPNSPTYWRKALDEQMQGLDAMREAARENGIEL